MITAYLTGTFLKFGPVWILVELRVYGEEKPTVLPGPLGLPVLCVLAKADGADFETARQNLKKKLPLLPAYELGKHLWEHKDHELKRFVEQSLQLIQTIGSLFG